MTTTFDPAAISIAFTIARHKIIDRWLRAKAARQRAAQVRRELQAYTERELADLGLSRADIPGIARAAYDQA